MKIAILLLSGGVVERGAETAAYSLATVFSSLSHEVMVFQAGAIRNKQSHLFKTVSIKLPLQPSSNKPVAIFGKVLERLNLNKRSLATLLFSLKSLPYLAKGNFDLIIPIDGFWEIMLCKLLQLFKSFKIMVIGLAGIGWTDAQNLKLKPDIFVALTDPMREWAKTIQPKISIVTIPLPVDTETFNESIVPAKITLNKPVVLTVAALTKYKRVDAVIRAVALLPEWSLLVTGHGEEAQRLQHLGEKLLGKRFQIIEVPHDSIAAYYRASDVFVLASEPQEAFGMVLLEAQACGLPIVTTDDESRRWILGDSAQFSNPLEKRQLSEAIAAALASHASAAAKTNLARFSKEQMQASYIRLFSEIT